jgi:hypothetical protein
MATSRMDHLQPVETKEWAGWTGSTRHMRGMKELKYVLRHYFESVLHAVTVRILRVPLEIAIDCLSGRLRREDREIRD